mmetsp:Transcript_5826/g.8670  ORF Transcript_5826/g.8670 Transcript_5826/m.8670 type:complete len:218 (-) Transcript_5826:281-934(-)|eukprot:CAMPEP_0197236526 /NCGR_PEP_ID=MMETSP1429-20130617/3596_1 /TAXON_ID=49237 /ORGANISM="Chaetoceros  sp., Strain UNC1202" /LENGTH=217 /DNA_ID=CAMNT_0042695317 /DNA_START=59 /DNA_END=712 /DNA_ORIENTATION=+
MKTSSIIRLVASSMLLTLGVADDETDYVTCGSAIKLFHAEPDGNEYALSSSPARINSGSGQQLVTSSPDKSGHGSLWVVKEAHGKSTCNPGEKIPFGTHIRLTHLETGRNLHSHNVRSPLSQQQEVTAFGEGSDGDDGDNWVVNPNGGSGSYWKKDQMVVLAHAVSGKYLGCTDQAKFHRNNCGRNCPVMDHLEVFGRSSRDKFTTWKTSVGVYLHK